MPSRSEKPRRGAPVVYSLDAHRDFVLGFRKRKQARRQKAKADIEAAEKQARRDERRQKRDFVRSNRDRVMGHTSDSDDDEEGDDAEVTTYAGEGDSVVTAVVAPMEMNKFDAPRPRASVEENGQELKGKNQKDTGKADDGERGSELAKSRKRLGAAKTLRKPGKRRVSYTHAMSKVNRRKKKLKMRREANKS